MTFDHRLHRFHETGLDEEVQCPECRELSPNSPDVRQQGNTVSIGFECTHCGHVWGHDPEVD